MKVIVFKYTKSFYLLFFLIVSLACFSQEMSSSKKLDSLLVVLKSKTQDTAKVNVYQAICEYYRETDIDKISFYNKKILQLSKISNYKKGLGLYYLNLSFIIDYSDNAKKAKQIFYELKDWDNYFYACYLLSESLILEEKYSEVKTLVETNLKRALIKKNKHIPRLYLSLARMHLFKSEYKESLLLLKKAMTYNLPINLKFHIYNNVALVFGDMGKYNKAIEYNNLSYSLVQNDSYKIYADITKIKILNENKKYSELIRFALKLGDNSPETKFRISRCYYFLGNYKLAKKYIDTVLKHPIDRVDFSISVYTHKAAVSLALHDMNTAENYINKALSLLKEDHYFELQLEVFDTKSRIQETLKNYEKALFYRKKIEAIKDFNYQKDNNDQLNLLQTELNVAIKENNIKQLKLEQLDKQTKIKAVNNYLIYTITALFVALLFLLFYRRNSIAIKRKNRIIENDKLLLQKSLLEKEILLKEIHHRVKNNLQLVMSLLYIQSKVKGINITDFIEISQSRILAMALIHENLYQTDNLSKVNFKEYVTNLARFISESYSSLQKDIQLKIEVGDIQFDIQTAIPLGLIINELVNNAYKHAFKSTTEGIILLQVKKKYDFFTLVIQDNGIGKLEKENNNKTLGLELVHQLVSQLNGEIVIKNNGGLQYEIKFKNTTI